MPMTTPKRKKNPTWSSLQRVALLGTYLPRKCGIATFTSDLTDAIAATAPRLDVFSVAMNDRPEGYRYPPRVHFEINERRLVEYRLAADFLNVSKADVLIVEHEYGIFGGTAGSHLLELMRRVRMPVLTTLHTVLRNPNDDQRRVMNQIVEASDYLIVLADKALGFMREVYDVPEHKIAPIAHGIHDVPFADPNFYKDKFGVEGRRVILTFGLLSPGKGIEHMIEALPAIVAQHPDVVYIVLGATHPGVVAHSGEDYRIGLKRRATELGVADHVMFVNKFVETEELMEFLGAADLYVTPYLNEEQICSGTLAYALGTGNAMISTPYWYAQEMLADGRGVLVPFRDAAKLAEAVCTLFANDVERHAMRKRAYQFTRQMVWAEVAGQYLDLAVRAQQVRKREPRLIAPSREVKPETPGLPELKLDHLQRLTDATGLLHAAKYTVPDRARGYRTDDNAQALIAVLMAQNHAGDASAADLDILVSRYLSLLDHALDRQSGRVRQQLSYERLWTDDGDNEACHGRTIWALGETVARSPARGVGAVAMSLFHDALGATATFGDPHAIAYALVGIHAYLRKFGGDSAVRRARENLANHLFDRFKRHATDEWPWLSDRLTPIAARLPQALLLSGRWMFDNAMIEQALRSLEWLMTVQIGEGHFAPVGSLAALTPGQPKPRFDQHPADAHATIDACLEAWHVTQDRRWLDYAHQAFNWFLGDNDLHVPLYDHVTGGCCDALTAQGVNENQSAVATLAWLLSLMLLAEHRIETDKATATQPVIVTKPLDATSLTIKPAAASV
jgi:glycosyltransferase involved in cell wall biosynthesis